MTMKTSAAGFLNILRTVALIAVFIGAAGSVAFMLVAGHPPIFLRILFTGWVALPFVVLVVAHTFSKRWSVTTRTALYCVMLVVSLISLAIYAYVVLRPHDATPTATFLGVPLGSLILAAIVVPLAAFISGKRPVSNGLSSLFVFFVSSLGVLCDKAFF